MSKPRKVVPKKAPTKNTAAGGGAGAEQPSEAVAEESVAADVQPAQQQLLAPKRATSPPASRSAGGGGALAEPQPLESAVDGSGPVGVDVRGSLTLLKTRAVRRRRSVAEVDTTPVPTLPGSIDAGAETRTVPVEVPTTAVPKVSDAKRPTDHPPMDTVEESDAEEQQVDEAERLTCPDCSRQFSAIPFQKHVKICAKVFIQKRKAFDSAKMRTIEAVAELQSQQAATAKRKGGNKAKKDSAAADATSAPRKKKWVEESNALREAMKMARAVQQAQACGAPLPAMVPSAPDSSLIQCPHCSRRFNDKAAERHINSCQNIRSKPSSLKRGAGVNASSGPAPNGKAAANLKGKW